MPVFTAFRGHARGSDAGLLPNGGERLICA